LVPAQNKKNANTLRESFPVQSYADFVGIPERIADSSKQYRRTPQISNTKLPNTLHIARFQQKPLVSRAEQQHHKMSRVVAINQ
jgi:hypothetical protein